MNHTRKGLVSITAAFDEALNPEFLNSLSLFSVLGGVKKHGKTVFSKSVLVNGFHYDDTAHTVTITLAKPFKGIVKATIRPGVVAANGASSSGRIHRVRQVDPPRGRILVNYLAQAYASTRGSAPALRTPVFGSMAMAAFEPNDHAPADCNL